MNSLHGSVKKQPCGNHTVWVYRPQAPAGQHLPAVWLCAGGERSLLQSLTRQLDAAICRGHCAPVALCTLLPVSWERDYTPWALPEPLRGRPPFTGEAEAYFRELVESAWPLAQRYFFISENPAQNAVAGYSLGGLAALWACAQWKDFGGCASVSGSLWYDGFSQWLPHHVQAFSQKSVYLSLGRSEERVRSSRMRRVGDCTREAAALLGQAAEHSVLEWNPGGHFSDVPNRLLRAVQWLSEKACPLDPSV